MLRTLASLLAAVMLAAPVSAEDDAELVQLATAYDVQGWEAVGRINIGHGMCTGALIAPRLVLTAAHCLYDAQTSALIDTGSMEFLAGWRNGSASAYRRVRRALPHPDYEYKGPSGQLTVSHDIALLELDSEIRLAHIQPYETAPRPRKGASVGVVSYAHDRQDRPSLQESCHVLARQSGTLILSCDVDFGSSGAPVFSFENGVAQIVSVVSAKAVIRERNVSLGTSLDGPLQDLIAMMDEGDGVFRPATTPVTRRIPVARGLPGATAGAKFVKP